MKRKVQTVTGAAVLGLAIACGSDNASVGEQVSQIDLDLLGDWSSSCVEGEVLGLTSSEEVFSFSELGDFDKTLVRYLDGNCNDEAFTLEIGGTYDSVGNNPEADDAKNINFTISRASIEVHNETAIDLLNRFELCGISDWETGSHDILGKSCLGQNYNEGDVIFDIYRVEDNRLWLGDSLIFEDQESSSGRPASLLEDRPYEKQ